MNSPERGAGGLQGFIEELETLDSRQFVLAVRKLAKASGGNSRYSGTPERPKRASSARIDSSRRVQSASKTA